MTEKPIALDAYETLAEAYASVIDTKPHNAMCERPATLSLLPDVAGRRVLDAGCGPGVYSEWLVGRGAEVLALDASPKMVGLARQRLGARAEVRVADLGAPLDFVESESFDVVLSPLVLDYVEDWAGPLSEFHRVLRAGGHFVFSLTHPFSDFTYYGTENYYATELVGCEWRAFPGVRVHVPSYRRPLDAILNPLFDAGFTLERTVEPRPTEEFKRADPEHYAELSRQPCFLCLRARK
ncbi:MAG TPA: class I SAM-dependent methyltransferase [Pyrinomonadaceae bacterium]|nr:class I SAM-dependent methyltransferase [Pyrinomonadaceae bacterium]